MLLYGVGGVSVRHSAHLFAPHNIAIPLRKYISKSGKMQKQIWNFTCSNFAREIWNVKIVSRIWCCCVVLVGSLCVIPHINLRSKTLRIRSAKMFQKAENCKISQTFTFSNFAREFRNVKIVSRVWCCCVVLVRSLCVSPHIKLRSNSLRIRCAK